MGTPAVRVLKRVVLFLLGVFFWFRMVELLVEIPTFSLTVVRWAFPQHGFDWPNLTLFLWPDVNSGLLDGALWVATAAIGWFYVFHRRAKVLCLLIALWGAVPVFYVLSPRPDLPSDASLIENFYGHRAQFERLRTMASEDAEVQLIAPWSQAGAHEWKMIPEQRRQEYRKLFQNLGILYLSNWYDHKSWTGFFLVVKAARDLSNTYVKGYAYTTRADLVLVESLDKAPRGRRLYRRLESDWYLFYHPEYGPFR